MTYHESLRVSKNLGDETVTQAVNVDTQFNPLPSIFVTEGREDVTGKFVITTIDYKKEAHRLFTEIRARIEQFRFTGLNLATGEPNPPESDQVHKYNRLEETIRRGF